MKLNHMMTLMGTPPRISLIRECALNCGGNILDVGCHEGELFDGCDWLANFMGLDIIKPTKLPPAYNLGFEQADAQKLPFREKKFNLVVMAELLEHLDDPTKALQEAQRVAWRICITTPNEYAWKPWHSPFKNPAHVRYYRQDTFQKELENADLEILKLDTCDYDGWSFHVAFAK